VEAPAGILAAHAPARGAPTHHRIAAMATALDTSRAGSRDRQFARLFRREIAPHLPALEAERAQGRSRFITTATAFVAGALILLGVLWPLDRIWAVLGTVVALAIGLHVLGSQQRRFRHRVRDLVMPAICRAAGDLRHSAGSAPGIPFDDLSPDFSQRVGGGGGWTVKAGAGSGVELFQRDSAGRGGCWARGGRPQGGRSAGCRGAQKAAARRRYR
jgi:hypothetical protein